LNCEIYATNLFPVGVTGNTTDSESVIPGSNPGWGAFCVYTSKWQTRPSSKGAPDWVVTDVGSSPTTYRLIPPWCNGSTGAFGSPSFGSIPDGGALQQL
jgi:hypothetical protein